MQPSDGPNGEYAQFDENGVLEVDVSNTEPSAEGVGGDAVTIADSMLNISNQGNQPVPVWITDQELVEGNLVLFYPGSSGIINGIYDEADPGTVGFPQDALSERRIDSPENAVVLEPGESLTVGIAIDSQGLDPETELLDSIRVHANAREVTEEPPEGPEQVSIEQLNENPEAYIGETVRVQGTLHNNVVTGGTTELRVFDSSVFVSDYRRVAQDRPLSATGTLPFTLGELSAEQRSEWSEGSRLEVVGTVQAGDMDNEETPQVSLNVSTAEILGPSQDIDFVERNNLIDPTLVPELHSTQTIVGSPSSPAAGLTRSTATSATGTTSDTPTKR